MNQIIIKPIISEKSLNKAAFGWYTFAVDLKAVKETIGKAVEEAFKVKVLKVKTMVVKGKEKRSGKKRIIKQQPNWKKAMVKLEKGQTIDLFAVTKTEEASKKTP